MLYGDICGLFWGPLSLTDCPSDGLVLTWLKTCSHALCQAWGLFQNMIVLQHSCLRYSLSSMTLVNVSNLIGPLWLEDVIISFPACPNGRSRGNCLGVPLGRGCPLTLCLETECSNFNKS